jgi:hypothetical protein
MGIDKENRRNWERARKAKRRKANLCWRCGKPPKPGLKVCASCNEYQKAAHKKWRKTPKGKARSNYWVRKWTKEHPDQRREQYRRFYSKLREEAFDHYGKRCVCCGESDVRFLTMDHVDGRGKGERYKKNLYQMLRNKGYPKGFQTMCWNCNCAKGIYGACPHGEGKG